MRLESIAILLASSLAFVPSMAFVPSSRLHTGNALAAPLAAATLDTEPPLSPLTVWGDSIPDIRSLQNEVRRRNIPEFAPEISAVKDLGLKSDDKDAQLAYFKENAKEIKDRWQRHGALVFRDFDLMKDQEGFQAFYNALGMKSCLDPLHTVAARPTVDGQKKSPVYEAVNKESRKNFFIGMHNEFVGTRAPRAAAFVCFKAAEKGGEFLIADGRRIFRDLDSDLVDELYKRQIRYSVMELPFFSWIDNFPKPMQEPIMGAVRGLASTAINAKVDFSVELLWGEGGYDRVKMLQARAPSQPPIVLDPETGEPTWFCNVHSHSSVLRKQREDIYGAERFEDGASQINKSDMFFGDDDELTEEQLKAMDECTMKNVRFVKMTEGDVVLLDNYKTLHGRNVFDGTRKHAVAWFEGWEGEGTFKASENEKQEVPFYAMQQ